MDGKAKKVLTYLTKDGGELELFDLSVAIKMDEEVVQKHLEALAKEGLVASRQNEKGESMWKVTGAGTPAKGAKAPAQPVGDDDEFVLEGPAPAASAPAAAPAPAPQPAPVAAPAPTPAPQPAPVAAPAPTPAPVAAPKPAPAAADIDDDFEPKPKKEKPVKEPKIKEPKVKEPKVKDDAGAEEFESGVAAGLALPFKPAVAAAIGGVIFIIIIIIVATAGGGGTKKAMAAVEEAKMEMTAEIQKVKSDLESKISTLEEENKALKAKVDKLEEDVKKAAARPAPAARPQGNRRR